MGRLSASASEDIARVKGEAAEAGAALSQDLADFATLPVEFLEGYRGFSNMSQYYDTRETTISLGFGYDF